MTPLQIALIPGEKILTWISLSFQVEAYSLHPDLFLIFTYIISYVFWVLILKTLWIVTLRFTGFDRSRGRYE